MLTRALVVALSLMCLAPAAYAEGTIYAGGIAQPQLRWVDSSNNPAVSNPQNSGFVLEHARGYAVGWYQGSTLRYEARIEVEMVPGFQLLDAYGTVGANLPKGGFWKLTLGQHFAPFSRETALSVGDLQFTQAAALTALTPGRQLGLSGWLALPAAPWLQVWAGVYNGKGINVVENLDKNFMYVGRIALRPIGPRAPLIESALGPNAVWVAGNFAYNKQNLGSYNQYQYMAGADAFVSIKGFSAYAEYFWEQTSYSTGAPKKNFNSRGVNVQAGYLLPIPGFMYRKFEVAFRGEAVAPNRSVPITGPGDPTQGRAAYIAEINYFHRGHNLKLQANYTHNQELDTQTLDHRNATYKNDTVALQLTYRLE